MNTTTKRPPPRVKVTPHALPPRLPGQSDESYMMACMLDAFRHGPSDAEMAVVLAVLTKVAMYDLDPLDIHLTDDQRRTLLAMGGVE